MPNEYLTALPDRAVQVIRQEDEKPRTKADIKTLQSHRKTRRNRRAVRDLDEEEILAALEIKNCVVSRAAQLLDVSPEGLRKRIKGSETLSVRLHDMKESLIDIAEASLFEMIHERGNVGLKASMFILERIGHDRGYAHKKEINASPAQLAVIQQAIQKTISRFVPSSEQAKANRFFIETLKGMMSGDFSEAPPEKRGKAVIVEPITQ